MPQDQRSLSIPTPDPISEEILESLRDFARSARGSFSPNTMRAYASDTKIFTTWCASRGFSPLPASPMTLVEFIDYLAEGNKVMLLRRKGGKWAIPRPTPCGSSNPNAIKRYLAAVAKLHTAAHLADPTKDEHVRLALRSLTRSKHVRPKQARALNRQHIKLLADACRSDRLIDLRDKALMLVAYDTLCRRSELVALEIQDLIIFPDGTGTILVRSSKTDQDGEGMVRFLALSTVKAVNAWLKQSALREGAIFRAMRMGDHIRGPLQSGDVARIFKERAQAAGLEASGISGHSTRVGAAQDLSEAGIGLEEIMRVGGWKTPAMVARYTENLAAHRSGMAKLARKQRR